MLKEGIAAGSIKPVDPMLFYFTVLGASQRIFDGQYSIYYLFGYQCVDANRRLIQPTTDMLLFGIADEK